ncbi:hypothetical protein BDFG_04174 [Blastomyces dermatitidis ATCC 26199]|nr:hypothetical protein BDFG_04174 [Blastomyces dermatitidis ATCC 26199]
MSYEVEHSTTPSSANSNDIRNPRATPRRPDLSSFFATLQEITPNPSEIRTRPYAVPVPGDISAAYRSLAEALNVMRHQTGDDGFPVHDGRDEGLRDVAEDGDATGGRGAVVEHDWAFVAGGGGAAEGGGGGGGGVLRCNPFLDDPYPLVVRLPCHTSHLFDLECVRPWLRLRGTCPLDRADFGKKERERERERIERLMKKGSGNRAGDDEEEEWDGMYG